MIDIVRIVLMVISGLLLAAAAVIGLVRLSKGPTTLDRAVATDLITGVVITALAMEAVMNRHTTTIVIMVVLALLGFAAPVAIARFSGPTAVPAPTVPNDNVDGVDADLDDEESHGVGEGEPR